MNTQNFKPIRSIIILLIFTVIYSSCIFGVRGKGEIVQQIVSLEDIQSFDLAIDANVTLIIGDEQQIEIRAQQNIIDNIKRKVKSGKWVIEYDKNVISNDPVEIIIIVPEIRGISISGSGEVYSDDYIESDKIDLSIPGSGVIDLFINANFTESSISGSGDIFLLGNSLKQLVNISGSGNYFAFNLESNTCEVNISGSGNCEVFVNDYLSVNISGSGNVYYIGEPYVDDHIPGSGRVIDSN